MGDLFNTASGQKISLKEVVFGILKFIQEDDRHFYKITIGTDSEILSDFNADFVTAIVVHRVGNGGKYFWQRLELGKFYNLRDRIIKEVILSLDVGTKILTELKKNLQSQRISFPKWEFEIHIDIGENGETKSMIQEIVGMVRAYEFQAITKPQSYAASNVADRHI